MTAIRNVLGLGLALLALPALALSALAGPCVPPQVKAGFDLHALQSRLMVVALTCRGEAEAGYERMVIRFRPDLTGAYRHVSEHFRRQGGNRKLDEYITNLANTQAQDNIGQGDALCSNFLATWQQLAELPNGAELARLASEGPAQQTFYPLEVCPPRTVPVRNQPQRQRPPATTAAAN